VTAAALTQLPELRDRRFVFRDRREGGRVLATLLERYRRGPALVLGIPSGGVPVGLEVAERLELPFEVVIARKIPVPGDPEAGLGAVSEEGDLFLYEDILAYLGLDRQGAEALAGPVREQLRRRVRLFRPGRGLPEVAGRAAIVVDDGLATGYTALACLALLRRRGPARLVLAVPTASPGAIARVGEGADEIACPNVRSGRFFAVAEAYREWRDLTEEEVLGMLGERFPA
jgi:predicted phosphoribosyltransferase